MPHTNITREQALALLKKYNQEPFHLLHALTVEAVMRWYAEYLGRAREADFWGMCGLLHDIDFEQFPQQHCQKAPQLLAEIGAEPELVHAVCSHGYGLVCDVKPEDEMEKVLFAADELTGLIQAAARMRPSKSCQDMELSSLKKKFKDKKFAAGCSRDVIKQGADMLGWELDKLLDTTLLAMRETEEQVHAAARHIQTIQEYTHVCSAQTLPTHQHSHTKSLKQHGFTSRSSRQDSLSLWFVAVIKAFRVLFTEGDFPHSGTLAVMIAISLFLYASPFFFLYLLLFPGSAEYNNYGAPPPTPEGIHFSVTTILSFFTVPFERMLEFGGRAGRLEFFSSLVSLFIMLFGLALLKEENKKSYAETNSLIGYLENYLPLFFLLPLPSIILRRMHDLSISGWLLLKIFLVCSGLVGLLFSPVIIAEFIGEFRKNFKRKKS